MLGFHAKRLQSLSVFEQIEATLHVFANVPGLLNTIHLIRDLTEESGIQWNLPAFRTNRSMEAILGCAVKLMSHIGSAGIAHGDFAVAIQIDSATLAVN